MKPVSEIAREIKSVWRKPYFGAVPYINAMLCINGVSDNYGMDDARSIINYFLANASTFRGPDAKRIKAELKALIK